MLEKNELPKNEESLSIWEWDIMITYFNEEKKYEITTTMTDYISWADIEISNLIKSYKRRWLYPVWVRHFMGDYEEYTKKFIRDNPDKINSWREESVLLKWDKFIEPREIIFMEVNVKPNPDITKQITTFKDLVRIILSKNK